MLPERTGWFLLAFSVVTAAQGARIQDAFQPGKRGAVAPEYLKEKGVVRMRSVKFRVPLEPPRKLPFAMRLNFFPDKNFEVIWERAARQSGSGLVEWTGRTRGSPIENAAMVVGGGLVTANVIPGNRMVYQVRTAPDSTIWIREFDATSLPAER